MEIPVDADDEDTGPLLRNSIVLGIQLFLDDSEASVGEQSLEQLVPMAVSLPQQSGDVLKQKERNRMPFVQLAHEPGIRFGQRMPGVILSLVDIGDAEALTRRPTNHTKRAKFLSRPTVEVRQFQVSDVELLDDSGGVVQLERPHTLVVVVHSNNTKEPCLTETLVETPRSAEEAEKRQVTLALAGTLR